MEPYVRAATEAINWNDLGTRIGDRKRPLAAVTLRRIEAGLAEYPQRVSLLTLNHSGHDGRAQDPTQGPLPARTRKIGESLLFPADRHGMLVPAGGTWNDTGTALAEPMRTCTARDTEALVTMPYVVTFRRNGGAAAVDQPLATVTAAGRHHGLVIPYRKGTGSRPASGWYRRRPRGRRAAAGVGTATARCWPRSRVAPSAQRCSWWPSRRWTPPWREAHSTSARLKAPRWTTTRIRRSTPGRPASRRGAGPARHLDLVRSRHRAERDVEFAATAVPGVQARPAPSTPSGRPPVSRRDAAFARSPSPGPGHRAGPAPPRCSGRCAGGHESAWQCPGLRTGPGALAVVRLGWR